MPLTDTLIRTAKPKEKAYTLSNTISALGPVCE